MNPALGLIIAIVCIAVWFLASVLYKPIGRLVHRIGKSAIDELKNSELIEKQKIDKWNGNVPTVQGSGTTIVDITD